MMGAVGRDLHHLPAEPLNQGRILAHWIDHNDFIRGRQKDIDKLPLRGKTFA